MGRSDIFDILEFAIHTLLQIYFTHALKNAITLYFIAHFIICSTSFLYIFNSLMHQNIYLYEKNSENTVETNVYKNTVLLVHTK